jgi:MFS family permease
MTVEAATVEPDLIPSRRRGWMTVGILLLLYAAAMLDRQILILMAEPIRRSLHIGDFEIGLLHGFAFVLLYATCSIPLGWAADRYSRRVVIFAGGIIWSLSCAASGLADTTGQLFVARMGVGFGEAALLPADFSLIT